MINEQDQTNHVWFQERIAAALANGLDTADRELFESHAAECPSCAAELQSLQQMEQRMTTLFAHPTQNLEDRIINSLRQGSRPVLGPLVRNLRIHPAIQKAATGIAAAIVLAGFGYLADQRITNSESPNRVALGNSPWIKSINDDAGRPLYNYSVATTRPTQYGLRGGESVVSKARAKDVRYGDGHAALYTNPFTNVNRGITKEVASRSSVAHGIAAATPSPVAGPVAGDSGSAANDAVLLPSDSYGYEESQKKPASNAPTDSLPKFGSGTLSLDQAGKAARVADNNSAVNPAKETAGFYFKATDADGDGIADSKLSKIAPSIGGNYFKPTQIVNGGTLLADRSEVILGREMQQLGSQPSAPALQPAAPALTAPEAAPAVTATPAFALAQPGDHPAKGVPATPPPTPTQAPPAHDAAVAPMQQKVIRNGQIEFEVDRFDSAFATVSKLTTESNGYVGTSDSEKLPNGKVKGTVTVRVPPDRLDTLLLQLRGIGDLKSQKLDANDVSKHYTDLESELRADRAMEERLLGIIKDGKGQIKDLLAAEKELGNWREKIENIVGEMRYLDSQVAMSTLVITLYERDIKTPATAQETENVEAGMEATDVEKARSDALKAIEDAKGRVIQSDLKRYDAGQFGATIVAEVPPDTAGPMLDRLKQIGKIARLDIQRKQTTDANADVTAAGSAPQKVQKKDTHLNLSIYNLANVAPRITTTMNLAADDVEKTYGTIRERILKAGGRVISSDLARNKSEKTTGTISFDVPSSEADAVLNDLRAMGEVMHLTVTDNPDVNNVTTAKRGYVLQLVASAAIAPRETTTLQIAATKVAEAREKILTAASSGAARVLISQLNETDPTNPNATIEIDVPRTSLATVEKAINESGDTISRNVMRSSDTENTLDTKVKLQITLLPADKLPPRETTTITIETTDVEAAAANLQQSATQSNGKILESNESKDQSGSTRATLVVELPQEKSPALIDQAKQAGTVRAAQSSRNLQLPASAFAKARIELTLVTPDTIVQPGTGPLATIRNGLATSIKALLWSLELIVIGLCTVLPFALVVWTGWKVIKRKKNGSPTAQ